MDLTEQKEYIYGVTYMKCKDCEFCDGEEEAIVVIFRTSKGTGNFRILPTCQELLDDEESDGSRYRLGGAYRDVKLKIREINIE